MGSLPIVLIYPCPGQLSDFVQVLKDVRVEDLLSIGSVESFHVGVLSRLAGRNELQVDTLTLGPLGKRDADELRPIVGA